MGAELCTQWSLGLDLDLHRPISLERTDDVDVVRPDLHENALDSMSELSAKSEWADSLVRIRFIGNTCEHCS